MLRGRAGKPESGGPESGTPQSRNRPGPASAAAARGAALPGVAASAYDAREADRTGGGATEPAGPARQVRYTQNVAHALASACLTLAAQPDPAQQTAVGRAFLLLLILIIVGILVVLGIVLAGYANFVRNNIEHPERKDRNPGVDAWEESARRATVGDDEPDDEDWEADEDERD